MSNVVGSSRNLKTAACAKSEVERRVPSFAKRNCFASVPRRVSETSPDSPFLEPFHHLCRWHARCYWPPRISGQITKESDERQHLQHRRFWKHRHRG